LNIYDAYVDRLPTVITCIYQFNEVFNEYDLIAVQSHCYKVSRITDLLYLL